jgi:hypothetical protein
LVTIVSSRVRRGRNSRAFIPYHMRRTIYVRAIAGLDEKEDDQSSIRAAARIYF